MPNCVLRYCKHYSKKTTKYSEGITFHKFPSHGQDKREKWIKFVQDERSEGWWLPSEYTCICSEHFREQDYNITKTGRRYLKKDAVPVGNPKDPLNNSPTSPSSLLDVSISDSESIFDSPRRIELKKDLRKSTAAKEKLLQKIKKLKRQCRYLKSKNRKLTDIIKQFKSNFPIQYSVQKNIQLGTSN